MDDGSKKTPKAEAATEAAPVKKKAKRDPKVAKPKKDATKTKEAKARRAKVENPVVFAFRLSEADRARIHEAAGSAKASQFVLAATMAAVTGDIEAFKKVVETRASK